MKDYTEDIDIMLKAGIEPLEVIGILQRRYNHAMETMRMLLDKQPNESEDLFKKWQREAEAKAVIFKKHGAI